MAATNYISDLYAHLWTLLLAHAPVADAIKERNRIRFDGTARDPRRTNWAPADFPELTLFPASVEDTAYTQTPRYAHSTLPFNAAALGDWSEDIRLTYVAQLIHRDLQETPASLLLLETMTALRKAGPKLGKSYVFSWSLSSSYAIATGRVNELANADGEARIIHSISIPVTLRLRGSQLIT